MGTNATEHIYHYGLDPAKNICKSLKCEVV
jgi:hypothetical protein